jgi:steroid delta-isomerase-like uncharacterized protein
MSIRMVTAWAVRVLILLLFVPPVEANDARSESVERQTLASNKALARRVYEDGLSQGRFDVPYTDDFVGHGGNATFTHDDGIAEAKGWRLAFPDLRVRVDLILAEADLVSVRWTASGTNTGAGNGIPATGKHVEVTGTTVFRMLDGAIAEEWTAGDSLGMLKQLGLLPAPTPASVPAR